VVVVTVASESEESVKDIDVSEEEDEQAIIERRRKERERLLQVINNWRLNFGKFHTAYKFKYKLKLF